jgi:hypothetical protein
MCSFGSRRTCLPARQEHTLLFNHETPLGSIIEHERVPKSLTGSYSARIESQPGTFYTSSRVIATSIANLFTLNPTQYSRCYNKTRRVKLTNLPRGWFHLVWTAAPGGEIPPKSKKRSLERIVYTSRFSTGKQNSCNNHIYHFHASELLHLMFGCRTPPE